MKVFERHIPIDELEAQIRSGEVTEMFACGTAAVITSLVGLGEVNGERFELKQQETPVAAKLRKALMDIQVGVVAEHRWQYKVT